MSPSKSTESAKESPLSPRPRSRPSPRVYDLRPYRKIAIGDGDWKLVRERAPSYRMTVAALASLVLRNWVKHNWPLDLLPEKKD